MSQQRTTEVVFILQKLRELDCFSDSTDHFKNKKIHLIELMSTFAELITSKQEELREDLRLIFLDIAQAVQ